jgi:hypothetical protein
MKRLTLVALMFTTGLAAAVPTAVEEKEVLAAMSTLGDAVAKRDVAALQRLLHDELVYSHSDARVQTKQDLLKDAQENRGPGGVVFANAKVNIYGSTAVVRGRVAGAKGVQPNSPHGLAVFVKGSQGWQLVARTATRPAAPTGAQRGAAVP